MNSFLAAEACHQKALDCLICADCLDDPKQKAAMVRYAEWWNWLAEYRAGAASNGHSQKDGNTQKTAAAPSANK